MQDYLSFKRLLRKIESSQKKHKIARDLSRWKNTISSHPSSLVINAHIMLIRETAYVDLAEICVQSFFHHHPNANFILHCDDRTRDYVEIKFKREIESGKVSLRDLGSEHGRDWQEQKLDLILKMSGTKEVFLDADLRWNGAITDEFNEVLFLVKEFQLKSKSPFREILTQFDFTSSEPTMKNLSVFSFGGYQLSEFDLSLIRRTMNQYTEIVASSIVGNLDKFAIGRVIEQFTLSVCSETWGKEVAYIKEWDKPLDGGIVESCYFGATGGTF